MELLNNQLKETIELIEERYNKIDSRIKTIPGIGTLIGSMRMVIVQRMMLNMYF